jgi:hypothetical protein
MSILPNEIVWAYSAGEPFYSRRGYIRLRKRGKRL